LKSGHFPCNSVQIRQFGLKFLTPPTQKHKWLLLMVFWSSGFELMALVLRKSNFYIIVEPLLIFTLIK